MSSEQGKVTARRVATGAWSYVQRHAERWTKDPEYRETFDQLLQRLAARSGRLGGPVRTAASLHLLLIKLMW